MAIADPINAAAGRLLREKAESYRERARELLHLEEGALEDLQGLNDSRLTELIAALQTAVLLLRGASEESTEDAALYDLRLASFAINGMGLRDPRSQREAADILRQALGLPRTKDGEIL